MLDKSLPYQGFIMKMRQEKLAAVTVPELPPGYHFKLYQDGDEVHWARLESSVLEFPSQEKALAYFNHDYRDPFRDELKRRCVFVTTDDGVPVSTATAWFMESALGHKAWLQWIATDPGHQGRGLARAAIAKALSLYPAVGPASDIYLHTQTWSHKAIYLYHRIGFEFFLTGPLKVSTYVPPGYAIMENHALEALDVLAGVYSPEFLAELRRQAELPTADEQIEHEILPPFPKEYVP